MAEYIRQYTPRVPAEEWAVYGTFTTAIMTDLHVGTVRKAKNDNTVLVKFIQWCWRDCGMALEREVLFRHDVINNFIAVGCGTVTESTRAAWRSRLRRIATLLGVRDFATMPGEAINQGRYTSEPYTPAEVDDLRLWARHQRTTYRKVNASLILALGLGAGLKTSEMLAVTARDVLVDDGGVVITVTGKAAREVPVRRDWEGTVATVASAAMRRDDYLLFPRRRSRGSDNLISTFIWTADAPGIQVTPARLRTTWLVSLMPYVPGHILAAVAGVESLDVLARWSRWVPEPERAQVRRMLRASTTDDAAGGVGA